MFKAFWSLAFAHTVAAGSSPGAASSPLVFEGRSVLMSNAAHNTQLQLIPSVRTLEGGWMKPAATACEVQDNGLRCLFPGLGQTFFQRVGTRVRLSFQADSTLIFQGVGLRGTLKIPSVRGWLSHGLQSWSQTGVIQVQPEISQDKFEAALQKTGEDEVYRRGQEFSWWYSYLGSDSISFLAGVTTADTLRSYVQFSKQGVDQYGVKLISGAGESLAMKAGDSVGETWNLSLGPDLQEHLNRYAEALPTRHKTQPQPSLVGWNSWYDLWDDVKESDFIDNIKPLQEFWQNRRPLSAAPVTMTLDDGWQKNWGDWYPNSKFPSGIDGLAQMVNAQSMQFGLWIAPLLVHPQSDVARLHPDWLVQDAVYRNPKGTAFRVLDVSQPVVAQHLQDTIRRLVGWGVQVLKVDFLFAGALEGGRSRPWTGMQAYHEAMRLMREAAGDRTMLVAVGAPPLATLQYADAWRVGGDIAFKPAVFGLPRPAPSFIANQARSVAGRQLYCQVTLCDADPALLRALSQDEVNAGVWVAAATGGAMVLSDHLPRLDRQRWSWGYDARQMDNGLSGQPARLQSYFPADIPADLNSMKDRLFTAEQKVPELWIMPDGTRVLLNFSIGKKTVEGINVPKNGARILP